MVNEVAREVANRVYDLTGAGATDSRYGFDLAWPNVGTLTLPDPQAYEATEVGAYFLTGTLPAPSPDRSARSPRTVAAGLVPTATGP